MVEILFIYFELAKYNLFDFLYRCVGFALYSFLSSLEEIYLLHHALHLLYAIYLVLSRNNKSRLLRNIRPSTPLEDIIREIDLAIQKLVLHIIYLRRSFLFCRLVEKVEEWVEYINTWGAAGREDWEQLSYLEFLLSMKEGVTEEVY